MKPFFRIILPILLTLNIFWAGCDQGAVLIDEVDPVVYNDSLRIFRNTPDSLEITFTTTADWHAAVARGGEWCKISETSGIKGQGSFTVSVDENAGINMRQTSIILESGNVKRIFKVMQEAGEEWFETFYWNRTNAQKLGLRNKVKTISVSNNKFFYTNTYTFDERGNLLKHESQGIGFTRSDTTRIFKYDSDNHRVECVVLNYDSTVLREYRYEYENHGAYVAYDHNGWLDQNPVAEELYGSVVPDLSASHKIWKDGGYRMGQDRFYSFDSSGRLLIINKEWKHLLNNPVDSILIQCDTVRIEYRSNLPYTSRKVKNTVYYKNGMVKMLENKEGIYKLLENSQKMVISSFEHAAGTEMQADDIEWYKITYNYNRDILEREIKYSGYNPVTDRYSKYEYDSFDNWGLREEDIMKPGSSEPDSYYVRQEYEYY